MGEKTKKPKKNKKAQSFSDDDEDIGNISNTWYTQIKDGPSDSKSVTDQLLIELKEEAKKCQDATVLKHNSKNTKNNSNFQWMKTVMSKGTVSDKIAAYTVAIQDAPVSNLDTLRNLVGMVKVGKKREYIVVIDTLTELFLESLLPPSRKLRSFHQQPLSSLDKLSSGNIITRKKYLSYWYFEGELKEVYTSFVLALNKAAHDTVDSNKEKAINAMYRLLAGHAEQEKNLLSHIVNKLGDPSQKVCSKTIYCLSQLLRKHPNMQAVVLREVEMLLFRQNVATRAQYYGLCFLSQFYLNHEDRDVARHLIEVYFSFFKACIKKGEVDSRMMSVLLMGVNRAYPYAKLEMEKVSEHIDTMYRVVHVASFNVSVHALALLYQVSDFSNNVTDRFFTALYKKLLDPNVAQTAHQAMFLSLVYKALSKDTQIDRVKVFVKRLLQIAAFSQPSLACGTLYLVSQLVGRNKLLAALVLKDPKSGNSGEINCEERVDVPEAGDGNKINMNVGSSVNLDASESEDVKVKVEDVDKIKTEKPDREGNRYNGFHRNPLYAGGNYCVYSELILLQNHFHPTVRLFTENVLKGEVIKYTGDPLKDFTMIRFLERFVFKNPKHTNEPEKQGFHPTFGKRKAYVPTGIKSLPVNSTGYLNEKAHNIPVDELFLYTYLQSKYADREKVKEEDDSDLESVASEEFEEMLDKMAGGSKDDEELDFMADIGDTATSSKKKKNKSDEDEIDDDEVEEEDSDGGNEIESDSEDEPASESSKREGDADELLEEGDEDLMDISDDDASDIVFDSDDDDDEQDAKKKGKKGDKFKDLKGDIQNLFASADEFSMLLEDEGNSRVKPGTSNAVENKDNAAVKQLAWEQKRDRWVKGYDKSNAKGKKKFGKSGTGSSLKNKRPGKGQGGNKSKKFKKK